MKLSILYLTLIAMSFSACFHQKPISKPIKKYEQQGVITIRPSAQADVLPEVTYTPQSVQTAGVKSRDQACLAEAIYFEAHGTGRRGMRAVGEVVLNRKSDSRFPNTICGVVDQRYNGTCQFSYRCDGKPEIYRYKRQKALAEELALELLERRGADITDGALFFHAKTISPKWFATLSPRGRFGGNIFYR